MPRLYQEPDLIDHDFAWNVFVEAGQKVQLFAKDYIRPERIAGPLPYEHLSRTRVAFDEAPMKISGIGISQPGAVLTILIGALEYTYSGPWYGTPGAAIHELVVPVRQSLGAEVHLLPGVDPCLVMVHLHARFSLWRVR